MAKPVSHPPITQLHGQVGTAIRVRREARGWSQTHLADLAALNQRYLGEVERGRVNPSLDTLARIAEVLAWDLSANQDERPIVAGTRALLLAIQKQTADTLARLDGYRVGLLP